MRFEKILSSGRRTSDFELGRSVGSEAHEVERPGVLQYLIAEEGAIAQPSG